MTEATLTEIIELSNDVDRMEEPETKVTDEEAPAPSEATKYLGREIDKL